VKNIPSSITNNIKPDKIPKLEINTNISSKLDIPKTPEDYVDEAFTPNDINFKPFIDIIETEGEPQIIYNELA
jgi:hypothetical protein